MEKRENIAVRVRLIEEKNGIRYAKPDGALYKTVRVFALLVAIYNFGINLLFMLGYVIAEGNISALPPLWVVYGILACTAVSVASVVLLHTRLKFAGAVAGIPPLFVQVLLLAPYLKDELNEFKSSFYIRHLIPSAAMFLLLAVLLFIQIRARILFNRRYKNIVDTLYDEYKKQVGEDHAVKDEEWNAVLDRYDPNNPQKSLAGPDRDAGKSGAR